MFFFAIGEVLSGNMSNMNTVLSLIHPKAVLLNKCYGQLAKPLKTHPKFPKNLTIYILVFGRSLPKQKGQERKKTNK